MGLLHGYDETQPNALTRVEVLEAQEIRLKHLLKKAYECSPYYHRVFDQLKLKPDDIRSPKEFTKIPFTTKEELRRYGYPYGGDFLAEPFEQLVGWHMTSGTTGTPVVNPYTRSDVEVWTNLVARCLRCAGVTHRDIVMNVYGYGLFTGGLGLHQGVQRVGAKVIPWGTGRTEVLVSRLKEFGATVITGTPSYELLIAETMRKLGVDPERDLKLRIAIPGAESMSRLMLERIDVELGLRLREGGAREIYGFTEALGPGVAQECPSDSHEWMHVWADHFLVEVVDPESGERLSDGEEGELVVTTLTKDAMPLLRYRTRDITILAESDDDIPHPKIRMIMGRIDDVVFYKGAKIYPSAINQVLMGHPEVLEYKVIVDRSPLSPSFTVIVETREPSEELRRKLTEEISGVTFARPRIEFSQPNTLPRFEGKSKRVIVKE
ncbi:phenylacetate--CoA ligase [Candidatus Marsarchaeota G2 archaeon ECH_B_2]|uniref:Phenylacetate--CoA ligase n=4 Tax=Candidatus Marsarchaeota group 2 TaxID=2203771 RepID=A0A2R6B6Y9_9ARCH|nr:MAG: phenylacetate--CoA ligase [Candidatus Marsarchaeota G2 archaeon ECH_B_SAG-M15]PSN94417.1 MAG: phenylacetate--CoA ligase [Candidatus Marsarchaeota G2 archaeon ECH_B_2]PSN98856.1 MAG: phenylacetate--CoA ligase [Candidatus Marsarchaeota G2 archaeon ECH_B_3]PSO00859.1 MAG: phenylacetate--CoA ligase [Candidatus Marsarchaeota G2 archaeon ECH_B_1]